MEHVQHIVFRKELNVKSQLVHSQCKFFRLECFQYNFKFMVKVKQQLMVMHKLMVRHKLMVKHRLMVEHKQMVEHKLMVKVLMRQILMGHIKVLILRKIGVNKLGTLRFDFVIIYFFLV